MTDLKEGYLFAETAGRPDAPLVFTFHGTGGDERQLLAMAQDLVPGARVVSPRGDVSEHGHLRFFRRQAEGVYDMEDLAHRTDRMARFLSDRKDRSKGHETIGIGYSNGANILASVAFAAPHIVDRLVLMHPLIPFAPQPQPGLVGKAILITAGRNDPIAPEIQTEALARWFQAQGAEIRLHWHDGGHGVAAEEILAIRAFLAEPPRSA